MPPIAVQGVKTSPPRLCRLELELSRRLTRGGERGAHTRAMFEVDVCTLASRRGPCQPHDRPPHDKHIGSATHAVSCVAYNGVQSTEQRAICVDKIGLLKNELERLAGAHLTYECRRDLQYRLYSRVTGLPNKHHNRVF